MDGLIALALAKKYAVNIFGDISTNVSYKGSVPTIEDLPSDAEAGDMYGVGTDGLYVYNGTNWGAISRMGPIGPVGPQGPQGESGESGIGQDPDDPYGGMIIGRTIEQSPDNPAEGVVTYGGGGTTNYDQLSNKPKVNNVVLAGNKSPADLGLADAEDISDLQEQIDAITAATDVRDVVANYAALQAYDTSVLFNNDIVKVLSDSTHSDAIAYYRWIIAEGTGAWSYIGTQGPFYTKSETDNLLNNKQSTIFDLASIRDNASNGALAYNQLSNNLNYIELTAEDSDTHEVLTFKIFGSEVEGGGDV